MCRPPGLEFRENSRATGRRSPATGFQRFDPPLGRTLLHSEAGKPTKEVGFASPRDVPWRGGGLGGRGFGGRKAAHGGKKRAQSGRKAAHAGASGASGVCAAPGSRAKPGQAGPFSGAGRAKAGRRRGKTGRSGALRGRVRRALGAKKPLFAAKRAGNGAVAGQKLAEKAGGVCRVIRHLQGIFGRFRRKSWGFGKAFPRAYRKELPFAPFLCRWRTVIGGDNLVVRSGCYLGRKE